MSKQRTGVGTGWRKLVLVAPLCLAAAAATGQQSTPSAPPPASIAPQPQAQAPAPSSGKAQARITADQARQLFSLVDELLQFSSQETGLPIQSTVKRQLTSRPAVESYLKEKFNEDESAKRLQRGEIVLKKFGLLDRDFSLKPFLLELLKEQIEAYYDSKTKTVYLLDWVDIEEQRPVLAHELTHALQDQHTDLEKWSDQTPDDVSLDSSGDSDHLAKDELDTAREAVVEGQATAVMMDYILKPMGKSLLKDPEVLDFVKQQMSGSENSPVLARAPLLLSESLLFPYREGLSFEQDLWMDQGQAAAFAGAMDRPPTSTWEIINPREYEKRRVPALPLLPNIHPLVDKLYKPYDIGQVGQLDLHILAGVFGGDSAARDLTPAWDGGIYWAGQRLGAQAVRAAGDHVLQRLFHGAGQSASAHAAQDGTESLALFYLSAWKNAASAQAFAQLYADNLGRKYSGLKPYAPAPSTTQKQSGDAPATSAVDREQIYTTSEGPVLITTRGKLVFVAESFDLDLARKLTALILDAQGTGELRIARASQPRAPSLRQLFEEKTGARVGDREAYAPSVPGLDSATGEPLTASLIRFFSNCGVMKAAADAAAQAGR